MTEKSRALSQELKELEETTGETIIILDNSDIRFFHDHEHEEERVKGDCTVLVPGQFVTVKAGDGSTSSTESFDFVGEVVDAISELLNVSWDDLTKLIGDPSDILLDHYYELNNGSLEPVSAPDILNRIKVDGKVSDKFYNLADKLEPNWRQLQELEEQSFKEGSEDDDLLKALERVSK